MWLFSASDNGIGIERKHYERILTLFQRLHTREAIRAWASGSRSAMKIVERNGGKIWVESGGGQTMFYFTLPSATP